MTKQEILNMLHIKGYKGNQIVVKNGGIEVLAEKRVSMYEFDYTEFVYKILGGKVETKYIHMLDQWTFTIECE